MTTIDHKQAIEHCFQALGHPQGTRSSIAFVRGAEWAAEQLAAPATAPAQPEIVDLLAEMYELILANKVVLAEKSGGVWTWPDRAIEAVRKHRSGPAQPERKPTTRKAFEEWVKKNHSFGNLVGNTDATEMFPDYWAAWKAATDAALDRAAEVCVAISAHQLTFQQRKSAATCAEAIRALKEQP